MQPTQRLTTSLKDRSLRWSIRTAAILGASLALIMVPAAARAAEEDDVMDNMFGGGGSAQFNSSAQEVGSALRVAAGVLGAAFLINFLMKLSGGKKAVLFQSLFGAVVLLAFTIDPTGTIDTIVNIFTFWT